MQNFSEKDILDYLMTSEFNEGLTPDEFKFLLYKFRYHYRLTFGINQNLKLEIDYLKKSIEETESTTKKMIEIANNEKVKSETNYNRLINKKLTWKERIKGKIIIKEDEIKRI